MGFPTITCEIAFGSRAFTDPGSWTDVSAYLHSFNTSRGRQHELQRVEAGTASVRLKNKDGRFTPENGSSPYSPNVLPLVPIRIRATFASIVYDIFRGFVQAWPPDFPDRKSSTVDLTCVDAFALFNLRPLIPYSDEVMADGPVAYWKLSETAGVLAADVAGDSNGPFNGTYQPGVLLNQAGPLIGGAGALGLDGSFSHYVDLGSPPNLSIVGDVAIEAVIYPTASGPQMVIINSGDAYNFEVQAGAVGNISLSWNEFNGALAVTQSGAVAISTNAWHRVAAVRDHSTGYVNFFLDGLPVNPGAGWTRFSIKPTGTDKRAAIGIRAGGAGPFQGRIAHVAVNAKLIAANRFAARQKATFDAFVAMGSGAAINNVLDIIGWPATLRAIDAGSSIIQTHTPSGATALDELRALDISENGLLFIYPDGKIGFHARHSLQKAPHSSSLATIGDQAGQVPFDTLKFSFDDALLYNRVVIERQNGIRAQADDLPTQTDGIRQLEQAGSLVATDSEVTDQANYLLAKFKAPHLRLEQVTLRGEGDDSTWPQILGRDIHFDRITVVKTPITAPPITRDLIIDQVSHDVTLRRWKCTWGTSPAEPVTYWLLGDPSLSLLGTTTRLGY